MNLYLVRKKTDRFFGITQRGSSFSKEIIAGILVFFSMIYILPVNSSIMGAIGLSSGAVFAATAISTALITLLMGFFANLPLMLSCSMGMNAYIAYTVSGSMGFSKEECLAIVMLTGTLFFILSITNLRMKIVNALPKSLKLAISAGLGAFICFVGLQMGGIIVSNPSTLVALASFNPSNGNGYVLLALLGIVLAFGLTVCKVKVLKQFSVIIALVITAVLGGVLDLCGVANMPKFYDPQNASNISEISTSSFIAFRGLRTVFANPKTYGVVISLLIVNVFDTTATLVGLGSQIGLIDKENGKMVNYEKAFFTDGLAPIVGGMLGTSPVSTFAETSVGVEFGARTGLSSIVTALLFLLTLAIFPVFNVFSPIEVKDGVYVTPVTCLCLVLVGGFMFSHLGHLEWNDPIVIFSSFITILMMMLTYSLTDGIAFGSIVYVVMMLLAKRHKEISPLMYGLSIIFIANFAINAVLSH